MNRGWRSYVAWGVLAVVALCFVAVVVAALCCIFYCAVNFREGGWKLFAAAAGVVVIVDLARWAYLRVCEDEEIALWGGKR